jgi:hypothetical protein
LKRSEVRGTWLESHFRWQIRTFWFGLLWASLCVLFVILTLGIRHPRRVAAARHREHLVHLPNRARLDRSQWPPADGSAIDVTTGFGPLVPAAGALSRMGEN